MSFVDTIHPVILCVADSDQQLRGRNKVTALSRHARTALAQSARWSGVVLGPLEKDPQGAPLPSGGVHWSVSHKNAFVAAVTAPVPVGIDLERQRPVSPALYDRLAGQGEWALARGVDEALFLRFWTAKEAVLKAVGRGLTGLARCRITAILDERHLQVSYEAEKWIVAQYPVGSKHLAAVTKHGREIEWHLPDEIGLF
jgi:4'-phosphopantetheinyl transferase